ncbi:MAG: amidohydrolase [Phaeodactylibacter sp.]|nr:amidohydrolase [Phaeodactylibacter sp.]MCB9266481.1 amidohydrolase [Lewinellaceae bacterium]MCB9289083.1 amidohydrolase [Lewinellaceae bacterium]
MLHTTLIQTALHWEDKKANLEQLGKKLAGLSTPTNLIVLPEMFTTGFTMNARPLAEPTEAATYEWMAGHASRLGAVVTGSFIVEEGGQYFNRLLWVRPDGSYEKYDKRHLFTLAGEHEHYTPGHQPLIAELDGWKVMPLICYDLRFPVWSRNTCDYDMLIYVANWPEMRRQAWRTLLAARAIENQAYTLGVNCVGKDGNGFPYTGDSSAFDFAGEELLHTTHTEGLFTVQLSYEKQQEFRNKLQFLADRDRFVIE